MIKTRNYQNLNKKVKYVYFDILIFWNNSTIFFSMPSMLGLARKKRNSGIRECIDIR